MDFGAFNSISPGEKNESNDKLGTIYQILYSDDPLGNLHKLHDYIIEEHVNSDGTISDDLDEADSTIIDLIGKVERIIEKGEMSTKEIIDYLSAIGL